MQRCRVSLNAVFVGEMDFHFTPFERRREVECAREERAEFFPVGRGDAEVAARGGLLRSKING